MRSANVAIFSVLITLAIATPGYAQNDQSRRSTVIKTSPLSPATTNPIPRGPENSDIIDMKQPGITVDEEKAIPYQPCEEALGWQNGRLRCRNERNAIPYQPCEEGEEALGWQNGRLRCRNER